MLPFGAGGLDPSKLDPAALQKLSEIVRELPPDQIQKMQTLMHNSMAGFDTRADMIEFEKNLPSGFREKMAKLMYELHGVKSEGTGEGTGGATISAPGGAPVTASATTQAPLPKTVSDARMTVLEGVATGSISPAEALQVLFPDEI